MKTKVLWISLLLAITLLFCSCTNLFQRESATTGTNEQNVELGTMLGKWYCADAYTVLELKEGNVFDYYSLVTDDYAYALDVTSGVYIVDGNTLTVPLEEDFEIQITYNAETDSFSVKDLTVTFSRVELLPPKLSTAEPQKFKGIWYNEDNQMVYDLREDGTLDVYAIQAGYYTYSTTESATYTVKDAFIEIWFEGAETPTELIYNSTKDSISNIYGIVYSRKSELPVVHPTAPFPNFAEMDCASVITLGEYKGLDLTTNATANAALAIFDSYYSKNTSKTPSAVTDDRTAVYGDRVIIDYTGTLDGVEFSGGSATNKTLSIIENSGFVPGFVEGIIGHKMGETFDVPLTFPEDYGVKEMAGKSVIFTMKLHTIYDLSISDSEIKSFSEEQFATYADMLAYYVEAYREQDIWSRLQETATTANLTEEYYNYFYYYYRDYYHSYAFSYGVTYEALLQYSGLTEESILEESKTVALPYVISQAIYKNENLPWDEEKYNELLAQYVADAMEYFKYTEEEAKKFVLENEADNLNATVTREIVSEWLLTQNN